MMKLIFFLLLTLTNLCVILAQSLIVVPPIRNIAKMSAIDSGNIRIMYALNAVDIGNENTFDDLHCLEIGLRLSKYYSYFVYKSDSLGTEWHNEHKNAGSAHIHYFYGGKQNDYNLWSEYSYSDFIKDFSINKLAEYTFMPPRIPNSSYVESIPIQEWTLCEETDVISNYLCQKATCRFRGRNFVAWFTPDIPVKNGPWKFGGLPGLILKVYDTDRLYTFECVNIENFVQPYPIKMYNLKDYTPLDRKKYRELMRNIYMNYLRMVGWSGEYNLPEKGPYNPLELE